MIDFHTLELDTLTNNQLKRIADYWLRQYLLRVTPTKWGKYFCPLVKKYYRGSQMQAAHFIDRSILSTRYDLENVHLVSKQSNMYDAQVVVDGYKSKHHKDYEEFLGKDVTARLLHKSKELKALDKDFYIQTINNFKHGD